MVFLFTDQHVVEEGFLELINNMLTSGCHVWSFSTRSGFLGSFGFLGVLWHFLHSPDFSVKLAFYSNADLGDIWCVCIGCC